MIIAAKGAKSRLPVAGRIRLTGDKIGSVIWNSISVKKFDCPGDTQDIIALRKIQTVSISQITLRMTNTSDTISPRQVLLTGYKQP